MTDDSDPAPRMMQTGEHTFVQWDTARRLGLSEWAPEAQVFAEVDKDRREKRAAASVVTERGDVEPKPYYEFTAPPAKPRFERVAVESARKPKHRVQPVKRPLSEILAESERNRAGPGPNRNKVHGG